MPCYEGGLARSAGPWEKNRPIMTILSRALPLLLAAFCLIAAGDAPAQTPDAGVVAQRGDVRLTATDLNNALRMLDPAVRAQVTANPQTLANFVRERALNMAVLDEARAKKWDLQPDVMRKVDEARDNMVIQTWLASLVPPDPAYPSEAEVTSAYESNKGRLVVPKQYHIAQIVLTVKAGATSQEDEDIRKKMLDLRTQVMRPKADFAEISKKSSQERQSADKGGDVGWIREPDMIPAVRDAVIGLSEGNVSHPVRVPDGWHVLKLLGIKPQGEVPLLEAKPQIVAALRQARAQRLMRAHLDEMLKEQPIQVNEIELTKQAGGGK
jgi:PPIC-type PPIASE domain